MSKHQTRRSLSVRGTTYAHLRDYCAANEVIMSDVAELAIAEWFTSKGIALPPADPKWKRAPILPSTPAAPVVARAFTAMMARPIPASVGAQPFDQSVRLELLPKSNIVHRVVCVPPIPAAPAVPPAKGSGRPRSSTAIQARPVTDPFARGR